MQRHHQRDFDHDDVHRVSGHDASVRHQTFPVDGGRVR